MNISSSQNLPALNRKALRSIKRILLDDLDQDISNFDEKVEEIAKKLLQEGISALESEKAYFPNFDATFSKISNDEYFKEYQNSNGVNPNEADIPVNNALLAEIFQNLKSQADKYDENFTLLLDVNHGENYSKETLMRPMIQRHKGSDFVTLFNALRPLLFDLLKRREGFEDFILTLRILAKKEKIASFNLFKQLEVKDLLLLLIESCSQASLPQLGLWFSYQFYPLPLISLLGQKEYKSNLDCCLEYLFQVRKPLITNIGTKSAMGLGKSSFLSYLFSTKDPAYFSTKNGFTHFGAVDLYVNLPSDQQNYILADVQSYREDKEFMEMLSGVLSASQIILVHITEKDISPQDGRVNLNFQVPNNQSKILYLWRDFDDDNDNHSELMNKAEKCIDNHLGIIGIPKLNAEQGFDTQNDKSEAMQAIFKKLKTLKFENCTPIVDLLKNLKRNEGLVLRMKEESKNVDFDSEIKEVENLLNEGIKPDQDFIESLLPCLFQDYRIIEERKKKKVLLKQHLEEMKEEDVHKQEEKYREILKIIEGCKNQKKQIHPSSLIRKVMNVVSSNELYNILLLSEIINNWKMPRYEEIRKKYIALSAQKDGADNQKNDLANQLDDKDLSLNTFLDEVLSYYESNTNARDAPEYEGIKRYLLSCMMQGAPLNLVNGKTLKFGNDLFKEIFDQDLKDMKSIFVISIIGAQSSAKSTLLNVLFGCGFSTSAGRCTKGIYISLLHHPTGFKIIVIDTEGLLPVVARDYEFDNLITTMAFSCSHVVIINNRGEINSKLKDLLEVCVYAMKHLKLTSIKPKIIFALRDILDNSVTTQQEMLLAMKSSLEQAANKLSININHIIDFSQEDIFLLPPAFQLSSGQNKTSIQTNNNLFSSGVLEMRQYIFKYLASVQDSGLPNPKFFYNQTKQLWNNISELGSDIMRAKSLLEIELKDEALDRVNAICKSYNEKLLKKGEESIEFYKAELRNNRLGANYIESFTLAIDASFKDLKDRAIAELTNTIFSDDKYKILANNEKEFKEIVEYNLRWQKQRFESEWKVSVYSFETDQEIKRLKSDISKKVNEKIQSLSPENLKEEITSYFNGLISKVQKEFDENLKQLRNNITNNLPREILAYFESAQKMNRDKAQDRVLIPTIDDIFDRIKGFTDSNYAPKLLYKPQLIWGKGDVDKITIKNEFKSFVENLRTLIKDKPSEETALNVINDCLSRIQKMEKDKVSVNRSGFMYYGLIEAMYYQYKKAFEVETKKTEDKQKELQKVIEEEKKHVQELLRDLSNSFEQGKRCANHWFKWIRTNFCAEQEQRIQEAIMKEIRQKFPAPQTANEKAYHESFGEEKYKNCLKYIFNINLFIQELYEQEIETLTRIKIEKEIDAQVMKFIALMKLVKSMVEEWNKAQDQGKKSIELGTLLCYIEKNEDFKRYFPDLYNLSLKDVDAFTQGCTNEIAVLIQKDNVEKELKATITQKTEKHLKSQYEDITGCQARCPMCFTKCTLANSPHNDHHTNCHLLAAFSGSHVAESNELVLRGCFDPKNYEYPWRIGEKKFDSYDEMIDKQFPTWRQEFPRKDQRERLEADVPAKVKKCWIAIKDVLAHRYGKKENTPKSWLDDAKDVEPLKSDFYLEEYMKKINLGGMK